MAKSFYTKAESKRALKSAMMKVYKVGLSGHISLSSATKIAESIKSALNRVK